MSNYKRKRILVTGGAGFLGSHLCDRLIAKGHDVLCIDNLFAGTKDNISHLLGLPPQTEEYWGNVNCIGPRSCYDEGKRCAETLFFDYGRQHKLRIKVIRIFNTYGQRMHPNDGRVGSNFVMQALQGNSITIYGDGSQTRSFCYVDDMVSAFVALMESGDEVTGPINVGNPGEFTMLELAKAVIAITGSKSKFEFRPLPPDDPKQRRPDISKAQGLLQWQPTVQLTEGLTRTVEYFEKIVAAKRTTRDAGAMTAAAY